VELGACSGFTARDAVIEPNVSIRGIRRNPHRGRNDTAVEPIARNPLGCRQECVVASGVCVWKCGQAIDVESRTSNPPTVGPRFKARVDYELERLGTATTTGRSRE